MTRSRETPEDVERWFRSQLKKLWPAGLGSLSLRRSPCIRERCHACQTGEQHSSYVLYGRHQHKRFAVYIPDALAPELRQMLENGRALQSLLHEAARRYAEALKRARLEKR